MQTKGEGEGCYQVAVSPVGRKSRLRERKWPSARRGEGEGGQPKDTPNLVGEKEKEINHRQNPGNLPSKRRAQAGSSRRAGEPTTCPFPGRV